VRSSNPCVIDAGMQEAYERIVAATITLQPVGVRDSFFVFHLLIIFFSVVFYFFFCYSSRRNRRDTFGSGSQQREV
jgi:hypothetical protein